MQFTYSKLCMGTFLSEVIYMHDDIIMDLIVGLKNLEGYAVGLPTPI